MNQLISIIIPVYKVEEYLNQCVRSVCSQTYSNLEIILVDDGSPDGCPQMCDQWANKDSRIKVIHQQNKGLSGARNSGLAQCKGEYVLYVDSDDTIDTDMVEHLYALIMKQNADIAMSTFRFPEEKNKHTKRISGEILSGNADEMLMVVAEYGLWQSWGKLIKREFAIKCPFCEKMIYEDYENTSRLFVNTHNVVISMDGRYAYTVRGNSIMGERQKVTSIDFAKITDQILTLYKNSTFSETCKKYMYRFLFKQLAYNYNTTIKYGENQGIEFLCFARETFKKHKNKWIKDSNIGIGRKVAYFYIAYFPMIYKIGYTATHK